MPRSEFHRRLPARTGRPTPDDDDSLRGRWPFLVRLCHRARPGRHGRPGRDSPTAGSDRGDRGVGTATVGPGRARRFGRLRGPEPGGSRPGRSGLRYPSLPPRSHPNATQTSISRPSDTGGGSVRRIAKEDSHLGRLGKLHHDMLSIPAVSGGRILGRGVMTGMTGPSAMSEVVGRVGSVESVEDLPVVETPHCLGCGAALPAGIGLRRCRAMP